MAIYDNNGSVSTQIGKIYDNNGTTSAQIGKVYDNNGTTSSQVYSAELWIYKDGTITASSSSFTPYGYTAYSSETNETTSYKWTSLDGTEHSRGARSFTVAGWDSYTRLDVDLEIWTDGPGGAGYDGGTWKRAYVTPDNYTNPASNYLTPLSVVGRMYTFDVTSWTGTKTFHVGSYAQGTSGGGYAYVRCRSIRAY